MQSAWTILMSTALDAKTFRVQVRVYSPGDDGKLLVNDEDNLMSLQVRRKMVARLVEQLHLAEKARVQAFTREFDRSWLEFYQAYLEQARDTPGKTSAELLEEMPLDVRLEAEALLEDRELVAKIKGDLRALGIAGEDKLAFLLYLVGTSRLLDQPLSARVHGASTSGKSYVIDRVARAFPPEAVLRATQMTPQALFYLPPGSLAHRWVLGGERSRLENDEAAEATRALREMMSTGRLCKVVPLRLGKALLTQAIEQDGPISFVESTSLAKVFAEDANRCLSLYTDERPEQTRRIITTLGLMYGGNTQSADIARIVEKHHALQRLLQGYQVVVPYAPNLGRLLNCEGVEMRRGFPQIIATIQAVTLLHQFQRERDGQGRLLATPGDYQLARHLLLKPLARLLGLGVSDPARRFYDRLRQWFEGPFSTTQLREKETRSKASVSGWLHELADAGLVKVVAEARGRSPASWELAKFDYNRLGGLEEGEEVLPAVQRVCSAW
jgi:hypothetical protein